MTQPIPTSLAAGEDPQTGQPFGFASPVAPPLSSSEPPKAVTPGSVAPPDDFALPAERVLPLEQIAPAPPERRDPSQPLLEVQPAETTSAWDPTQPVPGSATSSNLASAFDEDEELSTQELGELPPPKGAPMGASAAWPAPGAAGTAAGPVRPEMPGFGQPGFPGARTVPPATQSPYPAGPSPYPAGPSPYPAKSYAPGASPYPANPYATGAYSQHQHYPGPTQGGPSQPNSSGAADGWLIGLLILGVFWGGLAPWTLMIAGGIAAIKKVPARVAVLISAAISLVVMFVWIQGYFATDQLQGTAQLLSFICVAAVAISMRGRQLRRY